MLIWRLTIAKCSTVQKKDVCLVGHYQSAVLQLATNFEVSHFFFKINRLNASRGLGVHLYGQRDLTKDLFSPVAEAVISLDIHSYKNFHLSAFTTGQVILPTLQELGLSYCSNVTIKRRDFQPFPALRMLPLYHTAVESIEENAFDSLLYLRSLVLEEGVGDLNSETPKEMIKSILSSSL